MYEQKDLDIIHSLDPVAYGDFFTSNAFNVEQGEFEGREVVDIGANIGMFSIFACHNHAKRIIAAEPIPSIFEQLESNLKRFNVPSLQLNLAVFDGSHTIQFKEYGKTSCVFANGELTVPAVSLNTMNAFVGSTGTHHCPVLKLDCEGSEYEILYHASSEDIRFYETILLECHEGEFDAAHDGLPRRNDICNIESMKSYLTFIGYELRHEARFQAYDVGDDGEWHNVKKMPLSSMKFVRID